MQAKSDVRLCIRERLSHLSQQSRSMESRVICRELRRLIADSSQTIAGYLPLSDEPDITPYLMEILAARRRVCLPAISQNALMFRTVTDVNQHTKSGLTQLREPLTTLPATLPSEIAYVIVPGRAFTRRGERMGRGNGGYDRWICTQRSVHPTTRYIGVCFECQLLNDIPLESHDQPVDIVVTAGGVFHTTR